MRKEYYLNDDQFVIEDYDRQKTFASFLPGVAGVDGIPMWVFYTNRGQGIAGFGINNKDGSMLDFVPANQAYRRTEAVGYRTFIKKDGKVHEVFSSISEDDYDRKMVIETNAFGFIETNRTLGIEVCVRYFTITGASFPGLVRKVTVSPLNGKVDGIEILDGLTTFYPYGNNNASIKDMSNLLTAWFETYHTSTGIPFFRNRSTSDDSAEVSVIEAGHFYTSFNSVEEGPMAIISDPEVIFGNNTAFTKPWMFEERSLESILCADQISANKIPCCFCGLSVNLETPVEIYSTAGMMNHIDTLKEVSKEFDMDYFRIQEDKARVLGRELSDVVDSKTAFPVFDAYIRQSFTDNLLRGGYPLVFDGKEGPIVYHVFSRIHGDMEREYNYFVVEPAYYSQGVGNFRDVNQNRRNDVYFVPEAGLFNIRQFMELIQLDGFNPLGVHGSKLLIEPEDVEDVVSMTLSNGAAVRDLLSSPFTPGRLLTVLDDHNVALKMDRDTFLKKAMALSKQEIQANYGHGYWVDHWTYNMDLVDNYLNVYPDQLENLLFKGRYRYFMSPAVVLPQADKYVINKEGNIRQYDAVNIDDARVAQRHISHSEANWEKRTDGSLLQTGLFEKLLTFVVVKMADFDPSGIGIMMNADKPGWNDSMNGLPGLFGSGISETVELRRIVALLQKGCAYDHSLELSEEVAALLDGYIKLLNLNMDDVLSDMDFYNQVQQLKESYLKAVAYGVSTHGKVYTMDEIQVIVDTFSDKLELAVQKALAMGDGLMPSYLVHDAIDYQILEGKHHPINGMQNVKVTKWQVRPLPLYLEAPARYLKQLKDKKKAKDLFDKVLVSGMYDKKLKMYITSESLEDESIEIGRARAFVPGWLERESVFMHMEYKYLLGLIKGGLYDEFFEAMNTALPPFMDPKVYGRSTLENSSFIASSRNPNPDNHGRGFVSRLTGTTSEAISIWMQMMTGKCLFSAEDDGLHFELKPILNERFFDENNQVMFRLLGHIEVIYENPQRLSTYGLDAGYVTAYELHFKDGRIETHDVVKGAKAEAVRNGETYRIIAKISN